MIFNVVFNNQRELTLKIIDEPIFGLRISNLY